MYGALRNKFYWDAISPRLSESLEVYFVKNQPAWIIIMEPETKTAKYLASRALGCLLVLIFFSNWQATAQSEVKNWELNGYQKDMQMLIILPESGLVPGSQAYYDNLLHNRINFGWYPNDRFSFEADLRTRFFWGDQVRLQSGTYIDLLDESNDYFKLSLGKADSLGLAFHTMIDRLYLDYTIGNWQFRVGRQRINWGINAAWNPNDIFNAFSFTDFDYEEKPGSDAVLAKYYFNFASSVEIAVKAADKIEESVGAVLLKWNHWGYDFQLLSGFMKNNFVMGGGWAGNLYDAGFKGEFSWFNALEEGEENGFAATLGLDYVFKDGLYTNLGFLYNQNGQNDQSLANIFSFELSAKNLYPYKTALFAQASYAFNPLFTGGLAVIYSPVKTHPLFINPSLSYSLSNEMDLGIFGQLILEKQEKLKSPVQAFFVRFKYSF